MENISVLTLNDTRLEQQQSKFDSSLNVAIFSRREGEAIYPEFQEHFIGIIGGVIEIRNDLIMIIDKGWAVAAFNRGK